ncbi:chromate transporter [Desulfatirhabdium butyrativorans]|uniref:chromate transporter n=1 Tax=Desulfatirhabdium butyrativorans TaxID=340467 RepID=UPI0003F50E67|nr:chromate transporter [Desulfatirhabdium butyrativorans]
MDGLDVSLDQGQEAIARADAPKIALSRIAVTFLNIGLASFSLAALGEAKNWMTKKRQWFTDDEYMQGLGLAQLLPGAPTVNLSSYLGFRLRGLPGALVSTVFFLIPCFLLMLLLSHLYFRYGDLPVVSGLFRGLGALVVGLVFNTILNLWRSGVKTVFNTLMALAGFALVFWLKMGIMHILLIAGSASILMVLLSYYFPGISRWTGSWGALRKTGTGGRSDKKPQQAGADGKASPGQAPNHRFAGLLGSLRKTKGSQAVEAEEAGYISACSRVPLPLHWQKITLQVFWLIVMLAVDLMLVYQSPELWRMGSSFLKIGALTFGSGYAMLPFIQDIVVNQFDWLSNQQFAVALALSLITPGPVTIIGVFIGYKVAGVIGAVAGMVNMYYPAWAFTTLVTAPYAKAGQVGYVKQVISGIVAAFIGTLIVVLIRLSTNTLVDIPAMAMAAGAFITQRFVKIDTVWIVLAGALISLALFHG